MKKRLISLLLVLCMVFTLMPVSAFAKEVSADEFVNFAMQYVGYPYVSGGRSPSGFDCCGFVWYVCNHFGINVGTGNQTSQINYGTAVSYSTDSYSNAIRNLQKGDLVFFDWAANGGASDHVAIYTGNGNVVQAQNERVGVKVAAMTQSGWGNHGEYMWQCICGVRRVLSSSGGTPDEPDYTVTDFKATGVVKCVSKRVVEAPIGSSKETRTVHENDTVNVVGYVYNSNDDLYYKTDRGDFIHNVYLEVTSYEQLPPSNYCVAKLKVMRDEKHINDYPDSDAPTIKTVKYGDTVDVVGYVYNAPGSLWYAVKLGEETGFIQSNYLSVVSADRRTPSDYANTPLEVYASEKSVYNSPYSSSSPCDKKTRGDIFNTIGYVYNRYGNLWYIDDSEHCIYSSYLKSDANANLPSNYDFIELRAADGKIYKSRPYDVASTEGSFGEGDTVKSIGYIINLYGNKWYECENGYFIYDSNLSPAEYVITYNANGGSGTMSNTTGKHGETITFNNCTFTRAGYEFAGWNLYRTNDNKWHTQSNGWKTEKEIAENGYIKSVYCDGCSGRLDYSWANGCSDADEYVLYAIWEETIHTHSYTPMVSKPTCTEQGYTTYTCECGDSYVDNFVEALSHDFGEWTMTTAPTCTENGVETRSCQRCDANETREVAALGHNYVDGVCTRCGEKDPTPDPVITAGKLVVSDARAKAGEEVTVSLSIEENPGIMVMALGIDYDRAKLELVGFEDGIMTGWKVATNAVWIGADDVTANGVILKLKFKVLEGVENGDIQVSLLFSEGDIANHDEEIIMPGISAGTITAYSPVPGDVTGDGKVNALDLVRLQRYLSGEDVVIGGSCDITGDGKTNALDLVRLQRYLSGEDVVVC